MTIHNLSSFKTVVIDPTYKASPTTLYQDIVGHVNTMYRRYRDDRRTMENHWVVAWANYLNTPESNAYMRANVLREIGNVRNEWRHRINTGKAFEVIETIVGYLVQAVFPNRNWFECDPAAPEYAKLAKVVRNYLRIKMQDWKFRVEATAWIRQLCITGNSVMMLPWADNRSIKYETLDIFDCFFDPKESHIDKTPFIRRVALTRADVIERINSGFYSKKVTPMDVMTLLPMFSNGSVTHEIDYDITADRIHQFQGINISPCSVTDKVYALEYWGDIHLPYMTIKNCIITTLHGHLLRFVPNTYECGRPFVASSFIPVVRQVHGMSAIQSSSGLMHLMNTTMNQLADGIELAINPAYTVTPDSTLNPNDIFVEPGKMIPVASHDSIRPMQPPPNNFNIGFGQVSTLEQFVNQNTGTGPLISSAQPRGGERVTATEIQQVVEAGGNRLLTVYTHLSDTGITDMLQKTFELVQQFTDIDEPILMELDGGMRGFVDVGKPELKGKYKLYPIGAQHVVERTDFVNRLLSVLDVVNRLPEEVQGQVNVVELFKDIVRNTLYEDPERYIISQEQQEPAQEPPTNQIPEATLMANMQADGGQNLFRRALGYDEQQSQSAAAIAATGMEQQLLSAAGGDPSVPTANPNGAV